jgi:peptide/nickel transport system permease protein
MLISYISKRILQLIPLIVAISVIVFIIIQLPPGDYLTTYIQQLELAGSDVNLSHIENLKRQYALDQPTYIQYFTWIRNIVTRGDFGRSFQWNRPVSEVIGSRLGMTMLVALLTLLFVWLVSIPIGIYSATHQYSVFDYIFTFFGFIGLAVPGFFNSLIYDICDFRKYRRCDHRTIFTRICKCSLVYR